FLTPSDRRSFSMEIDPQPPMENTSLLNARAQVTSVPAKVEFVVESVVEKVGRGSLFRFREGKSRKDCFDVGKVLTSCWF
ncbi:hypothetical protein U1Q18_025633, partial [Sarracenia purpurea var. burkii]